MLFTLEATGLLLFSWNLTRMFDVMLSRSSLNMSHIESETWTLGQISLKSCSVSRGRNFCFNRHETSPESLPGWYLGPVWILIVGSKTRSLCKISLKTCSPYRGNSFASIVMKLHQNVCLVILVKNKGKRKVQGVPQSQTAALPRPQEEEETDKSKQAQIEQTYEKH